MRNLYAPVLPFVINVAVIIIAAIFLREPLTSNPLQVQLSNKTKYYEIMAVLIVTLAIFSGCNQKHETSTEPLKNPEKIFSKNGVLEIH